MPEPFLQLSAAASGWLLTYLLHSSVLIGGAWLVTGFVDMRPATRAFLWKLALVGGIGTTTVMVAMLSREDVVVLRTVEARMQVVDGFDVPRLDGAGVMTYRAEGPAGRVQARFVDPTPECVQAVRSGSAARVDWMADIEGVCGPAAGVEWFHVMVALWLSGGLLGLGVLARHHRALNDLSVCLRDAEPRSRKILDALGAGSVRLKASDLVGVPCVLPGNTIVLSRRCEEELGDAELRAVLAHELAHISRRDVFWSTIVRAVATVFWIQPLNRFALAKLVEAVELTCDDWAVARTGEPLGLANSISRVAEWATPPLGVSATISMAGQDGHGLAHRVRRILSSTRSPNEPRWLRPLVAVLLVIPLYWLPRVQAPSSAHAMFIFDEREVLLLDPAVTVERHIVIARLPPGVRTPW